MRARPGWCTSHASARSASATPLSALTPRSLASVAISSASWPCSPSAPHKAGNRRGGGSAEGPTLAQPAFAGAPGAAQHSQAPFSRRGPSLRYPQRRKQTACVAAALPIATRRPRRGFEPRARARRLFGRAPSKWRVRARYAGTSSALAHEPVSRPCISGEYASTPMPRARQKGSTSSSIARKSLVVEKCRLLILGAGGGELLGPRRASKLLRRRSGGASERPGPSDGPERRTWRCPQPGRRPFQPAEAQVVAQLVDGERHARRERLLELCPDNGPEGVSSQGDRSCGFEPPIGDARRTPKLLVPMCLTLPSFCSAIRSRKACLAGGTSSALTSPVVE